MCIFMGVAMMSKTCLCHCCHTANSLSKNLHLLLNQLCSGCTKIVSTLAKLYSVWCALEFQQFTRHSHLLPVDPANLLVWGPPQSNLRRLLSTLLPPLHFAPSKPYDLPMHIAIGIIHVASLNHLSGTQCDLGQGTICRWNFLMYMYLKDCCEEVTSVCSLLCSSSATGQQMPAGGK